MDRYESARALVLSPVLLLAAAGVVFPLTAQQGEHLLAFHVRDRRGWQVEGLTADDVVLQQGDRRLPVDFFWSASGNPAAANAPPVELILVFDTRMHDSSTHLREPGDGLEAVLEALPRVRVAVYGYDQALRRYGRPTRDLHLLTAAIWGTMAIHPGEVKTFKVPLDPPLKGPAAKHDTVGWDEVLIQTAWDAKRQSGEAIRLVVPFFGGLPGTTGHPDLVLSEYQALGIALYPSIRWHFWVREYIDAAGSRMAEDPDLQGAGLHWSKMTDAEKLDWVRGQETRIRAYESLGEATGGWSFDGTAPLSAALQQLAWELGGLYVAGYHSGVAPDLAERHKLEIRLKDPAKGQIFGGRR
jgi:hypothetical protein